MTGPDAALLRELGAAAELDLEAYRPDHVAERIRRACRAARLDDASELPRRLRTDPTARDRFRRSVAVSHTGLFRDPAQFELIEHELLPRLLRRGGTLRVWSAGSADGSELYSVALVLERLGALDRAFLLGSDVLAENVDAARRGPAAGVEISDAVRARVRFERRDLVRDPAPPGRFGLVLCRNVAIYFAPDTKARVHAMLAAALAPHGWLVVGRSERIGRARELGLAAVAPQTYALRSPEQANLFR